MLVYRATCTATGKAYVGITAQSLSARIAQHVYKSKKVDTPFAEAIRLHGANAFEWEVLERVQSREEMFAAEKKWVLACAAHVSTGGYNLTRGGAGSAGMRLTVEQRANVSRGVHAAKIRMFGLKRQKSMFHNRTGTIQSADTRRKISQSLRNRPIESFAHKIPRDAVADIQSRRQRGESFRQIGGVYGVRPETVFYFCKRHAAGAVA